MKFLNKKAFTLIELLVVVLIIGILAAIALPQYRLVIEKARAADAISRLGPIYSALERYRLAYGSYPDISGDKVAGFNKILDIEIPPVPEGWNFNYVKNAYVGYILPGDIYIIFEWRYLGQGKKVDACVMVAANKTDAKVKICQAICGHSNMYYYGDAYGCAINDPDNKLGN